MPFPQNILDPDEQVVAEVHPHWRRVVVPVVLVPVIVVVASYLWFVVPGSASWHPLRIAILVIALLALAWWSLRPWLRWRTTRYIVTTRRVVTRTGVLSRNGRDIPLTRVNDVSFQHTLVERLFGSGTLTVESAGERGQVVLSDVPRVEAVQREIYRLVEGEAQRLRE